MDYTGRTRHRLQHLPKVIFVGVVVMLLVVVMVLVLLVELVVVMMVLQLSYPTLALRQ